LIIQNRLGQTMQCSKCRNEGIIFQPYSGQHLCREHFISDFEAKAKRAIRLHRGMQPGDSVGVVMSGDPADDALLFFFRKLSAHRRDIRVTEVPAREISRMNSAARDAGVTKIALSTPLEDAAASALTTILQGHAESFFTSGPETPGGLPLITPFYHIPANEVLLYARIHGLDGDGVTSSRENSLLHTEVKTMLTDYSVRHPAAPHAVLNLRESLKRTGTVSDGEEKYGA
jgi:hypothetical protein